MSYFLPETDPVLTAARGLALAHPRSIGVHARPLYLRALDPHPARTVALVSGGGSGHEPLHTGMLGRGGLDAVCPGQVFASPHNRQIFEASAAVAGPGGVLHIVKNYTGDVINFRIAAERLRAEGVPVETVLVDDDLATGLADTETGRRGTAATTLVEKLLGAAADQGATLAELAALGTRIVERSRTVAVAARAQTSPSTAEPAFALPPGQVDYGVGIHGERGTSTVARPPVAELVRRMVDDLLDALPAGPGEVFLVVNGLGGTSELELHAVAALASDLLTARNFRIGALATGNYTTALDMAGFSLTLTRAEEGWAELWAAPSATPLHLPRPGVAPRPDTPATGGAPGGSGGRAPGSRAVLDRYALIVTQVRDNLTKLDQLAGDGDFGDNLSGGVRRAVELADATGADGVGCLAETFLDQVGGTSGPLFGLLFQHLAAASRPDGRSPAPAALAEATARGLDAVRRVGGAEPGDCTLIDALEPAVRSLADAAASDTVPEDVLTGAAQAAIRGALATAALRARRGRASYVGDRAVGVPDPGAVAVALLFIALADVHEPAMATRLPAPAYITLP